MNMHGVLGDIVAVFIGLTDHMATSHPGTGNQGGKAPGVVVSTVVVGRQSSLRINGSTELTSPNDECIVEEPSLLEIFDQGSGRLVGISALEFDRVGQSAVVVPAHMEKLDEPNIALGQSTGQEAIGCIGSWALNIRPIFVQHMRWFVGNIQ